MSAPPTLAPTARSRRLEHLCADAPTRPHDGGLLIIDETGDRKDGQQTAHVAHQDLGSLGKIANGIVAVSSVWADAAVDYPLHGQPSTPACRLPTGKADPAFRTKPQIAGELVDAALEAGVPCRAVGADCRYGEHAEFGGARWEAVHTPEDAARALPWAGPRHPGGGTPVVRRFRAGHRETWWAADLTRRRSPPPAPGT